MYDQFMFLIFMRLKTLTFLLYKTRLSVLGSSWSTWRTFPGSDKPPIAVCHVLTAALEYVLENYLEFCFLIT